jgi:hypothetical protein
VRENPAGHRRGPGPWRSPWTHPKRWPRPTRRYSRACTTTPPKGANCDLDHEELIQVRICRSTQPASTIWCRSRSGTRQLHPFPRQPPQGLSNLARLVDTFAKRPQCRNACHSDRQSSRNAPQAARCDRGHRMRSPVHVLRGICKPKSKTVTSAVRGQLLKLAAPKPPASSTND